MALLNCILVLKDYKLLECILLLKVVDVIIIIVIVVARLIETVVIAMAILVITERYVFCTTKRNFKHEEFTEFASYFVTYILYNS